MAFDYGYCIEPGCGERFVKYATQQRHCDRHTIAIKKLKTECAKSMKCKLCEKVFTPRNAASCYCSGACSLNARQARSRKKKNKTSNYNKTLQCAKCETWFKQKHHSQYACSVCLTPGVVRDVPKTGTLPCHRCKHSKENKEATYGIECTIGFWLRCKPLNLGAKPLEVRSEAMDSTA